MNIPRRYSNCFHFVCSLFLFNICVLFHVLLCRWLFDISLSLICLPQPISLSYVWFYVWHCICSGISSCVKRFLRGFHIFMLSNWCTMQSCLLQNMGMVIQNNCRKVSKLVFKITQIIYKFLSLKKCLFVSVCLL